MTREQPRITLDAAVEAALNGWRGLRSYERNRAQVRISVDYLKTLGAHYVDEVSEAHVALLRDWCVSQGLAPATVNCRMSTISALGVQARYVRVPRQRKWYLSAPEEDRLGGLDLPRDLLTFIRWTVETGLRVEESLALKWSDVDLARGTVHIPGTKTDLAQATLPISAEATRILADWQPSNHQPTSRVFPVRYQKLRKQWEIAREKLGLKDQPTATLKAMRRSFARRAHVNGMPVDILRQYLRHGNLKTTQGYLWLVGGYSQDEMRRYL